MSRYFTGAYLLYIVDSCSVTRFVCRVDLANMEFQFIQSTVIASVCIFAAVVALAYRAILPKPIPGIPYNKASASRILGDAPDVSCSSSRNKLIYSLALAY